MVKPFSLVSALLLVVVCGLLPAGRGHSEAVTEDSFKKAQLRFEQARSLLSLAMLETDRGKRLALLRRIAQDDDLAVELDDTPLALAGNGANGRLNAFRRIQLWTHNIHEFAALQVQAPTCFGNLTVRCLLELLAERTFADSRNNGDYFPSFADVALEFAKVGGQAAVLDRIDRIPGNQSILFDALYAAHLFKKGSADAAKFLRRAMTEAEKIEGTEAANAWTMIAEAHKAAADDGAAVNAITRSLTILEAEKTSTAVTYHLAWTAKAAIDHDIGGTLFKISLVQRVNAVLSGLPVPDRIVPAQQLSSGIGRLLAQRVVTENIGTTDAINSVRELAPHDSASAWSHLIRAMIDIGRSERVEGLIANQPAEWQQDIQDSLLVEALAALGKFDEALALVPAIRADTEKVNAVFLLFRAQLIQHNDRDAAEQTLSYLGTLFPPLASEVQRFPEGHTLTIWQGVTTGARALADIRRAEMHALLGDPKKGRDALERALSWLQSGANDRESRALTYFDMKRPLSPLFSAWLSVMKSDRSGQQTGLFEIARKAGALMRWQRLTGTLSLGGIYRGDFFRQIAALHLVMNRPREANAALAEMLFSEGENLDDLIYSLVKAAGFLTPAVMAYPR